MLKLLKIFPSIIGVLFVDFLLHPIQMALLGLLLIFMGTQIQTEFFRDAVSIAGYVLLFAVPVAVMAEDDLKKIAYWRD